MDLVCPEVFKVWRWQVEGSTFLFLPFWVFPITSRPFPPTYFMHPLISSDMPSLRRLEGAQSQSLRLKLYISVSMRKFFGTHRWGWMCISTETLTALEVDFCMRCNTAVKSFRRKFESQLSNFHATHVVEGPPGSYATIPAISLCGLGFGPSPRRRISSYQFPSADPATLIPCQMSSQPWRALTVLK